MKHPFWIVNSLLFLFVVVSFMFIYMSRVLLPERENIEPIYVMPKKDRKLDINIRKIYEDDLFGTYKIEFKPEKRDFTTSFPEPPVPQVVAPPAVLAPEFLDPLDITLKGIVVISINDSKNRAIIEDNKTKQEETHKIGDTIEDAQLIRIFRNKVIFLRSNGQQEVLYLREQDAKLDPAFAIIDGWEDIVQKVNENNYIIDSQKFIERVTNLAQFIDILGLTSIYQRGKSIGCRIGQVRKGELGGYLGLQTGDIIHSINGILATNTANRLAIYKNVVALSLNDIITVKLLRDRREQTFSYTLQKFGDYDVHDAKESIQAPSIIQPLKREQQEKILKQKHEFAPTMKEIRARERRNMFEKGGAPQ